MSLEGKVALVTGANRGSGEGCALELARRGADIAVNYRRHGEEAEAVAEEVRRLGRRAIVLQGDVSDRQRDEGMVRSTVSELGSLDILVANAAASIRKPFIDLTEEDLRFTIDVCLWGVIHCCQFAARQMVAQGRGGNIVVVSSVHAVLPIKHSLPYNTAKAGINHMARTMASELVGEGIRVNILEPGWIDTPGERTFSSEDEIKEAGKRLPMSRLGTIEEIGKGVAFLASDDASYVTGSTLRVDGGFVLPPPGF